eukprot:1252034-Rhodomonas_salina.2
MRGMRGNQKVGPARGSPVAAPQGEDGDGCGAEEDEEQGRQDAVEEGALCKLASFAGPRAAVDEALDPVLEWHRHLLEFIFRDVRSCSTWEKLPTENATMKAVMTSAMLKRPGQL